MQASSWSALQHLCASHTANQGDVPYLPSIQGLVDCVPLDEWLAGSVLGSTLLVHSRKHTTPVQEPCISIPHHHRMVMAISLTHLMVTSWPESVTVTFLPTSCFILATTWQYKIEQHTSSCHTRTVHAEGSLKPSTLYILVHSRSRSVSPHIIPHFKITPEVKR